MSTDVYFDGERYVDIESSVQITGMSAVDIENLATYGILKYKKVGPHKYFSYRALQESLDEKSVEEVHVEDVSAQSFVTDLNVAEPQARKDLSSLTKQSKHRVNRTINVALAVLAVVFCTVGLMNFTNIAPSQTIITQDQSAQSASVQETIPLQVIDDQSQSTTSTSTILATSSSYMLESY